METSTETSANIRITVYGLIKLHHIIAFQIEAKCSEWILGDILSIVEHIAAFVIRIGNTEHRCFGEILISHFHINFEIAAPVVVHISHIADSIRISTFRRFFIPVNCLIKILLETASVVVQRTVRDHRFRSARVYGFL